RRPVAVAVEQRADDAAVEDVVECRVMRLRRPVADELVPLAKAADAQSFVVGRTAAEAAVLRRVRFLDALGGHGRDCIRSAGGSPAGPPAARWRLQFAPHSPRRASRRADGPTLPPPS